MEMSDMDTRRPKTTSSLLQQLVERERERSGARGYREQKWALPTNCWDYCPISADLAVPSFVLWRSCAPSLSDLSTTAGINHLLPSDSST